MSLLLRPSVPYVPNRSDIWDAHVPPYITVPPQEGEIPVTTLYSESLTMGFSAFYNKDAYVSSKYSEMSGGSPAAVGTKDDLVGTIVLQCVAHAPTQNRFDVIFTMPIKSFKVNGILVDDTYLSQSPGFFYFNILNVGGFEALYNLVSGDPVLFTEITPFGGL